MRVPPRPLTTVDEVIFTVRRFLRQPEAAIRAYPRVDGIVERVGERRDGVIADFPDDWWIELGAIGTFDDVITHIEAPGEAGANDVGLRW